MRYVSIVSSGTKQSMPTPVGKKRDEFIEKHTNFTKKKTTQGLLVVKQGKHQATEQVNKTA